MDPTLVVLDVFQKISEEIEGILKGLKQLSDKEPNVKDQVIILNNSADALFQKFMQVCSPSSAGYQESDSSSLNTIALKVTEIKKNLQELVEEISRMNYNIQDIKRDAEANELVTIVDIKKVDEAWFIKVRSDSKCQKNFRNVQIWDISNDLLITEFKLIEPKVIVKRKIDQIVFPLSQYVAKIGERVISIPFIVQKVAIIKIEEENGASNVTVKNYFNEDLKDLVIQGNYEPIGIIDELPAFGEQTIQTPLIQGSIYLQVMEGKIEISHSIPTIEQID